uniref:Uncharacterized protein n=1 Tax=Aegilops tauschii subsp. strangulata TaxID=200361 RepID=A0A452ZW36_AEGTS
GISAGSISYVPSYNPRGITADMKKLLNRENGVRMKPWYQVCKVCEMILLA